jgi:hypothetical protein
MTLIGFNCLLFIQASKSDKFHQFMVDTIQNNARCGGLDISAYLLTPIQRLPRYVLLLSQLLKVSMRHGHTTLFDKLYHFVSQHAFVS